MRAAIAKRGLWALLIGALMLPALGAASAQADSPNWRVLGVAAPTNFKPSTDEIQDVSVDATGGSFTLTAHHAIARGRGGLDSANDTTIGFPTVEAGTFAIGQEVTGEHIAPGTTITEIIQFGAVVLQITLSQPMTNSAPVSSTTFYAIDESDTTDPIVFDAAPSELKSQIESLTVVGGAGGSVEVEGGPGDAGGTQPYSIRFTGSLAGVNLPPLTPDPSDLTGGAGSVSVATASEAGEPGTGNLVVYATNVGGVPTSGTVTLTIGPLPTGITTSGPSVGTGWNCAPTGAGASTVTCTRTTPVQPGLTAFTVTVPLEVGAGAAPSSTVPVVIEGGGAPSQYTHDVPLVVSSQPAQPGLQAFWAGAFDEDGVASTQAGGHPARAGAAFLVNTLETPTGLIVPAGDLRDVDVELPPGFIGNPLITERCPPWELTGTKSSLCTDDAVVGRVTPSLENFRGGNSFSQGGQGNPVYNNVPQTGYPAQFTFPFASAQSVLVGELRSDRDYGVTVKAPNVPLYYYTYGAFSMLDGNPPGAGGKAFLVNPTGCAEQAARTPVTNILSNTWQASDVFSQRSTDIPPVTGCESLEFGTPEVPVDFAFQPGSSQGATGTSASAELSIDQAGLTDPAKLATPHLKKSVVTLPEGLNLNPAAANGLQACSTSQMGYKGGSFPAPNPTRFDKEPVGCPDASKVGTAEVKSPLLEDPLQGTVYLGAQGDNPFDSLIALYIVVEDERTGITLKLPGKVTPNPATGQLTAEFDNNPQAPFEELNLKFRGGGPRSTLATPDVCGTYETKGSWTPWSAPESGPPAQTVDSFEIAGNCAPSKAQRPFDLGLTAGVTDPVAGKHSPFVLRLTRPDGNQELGTVEAAMPPGFTATLKGVATCTDAQLAGALARSNPGDGQAEIASPSCPASSQIGTTKIGAGVGPEPVYVDGKAYLTGPYKGAPISLSFVVPAVAGPFDLGVQVVRAALNVDPKTAQITAVSDPVPQILSGIPVQLKDVRVNIDRDAFALNPTSCEAMQIDARIGGGSGAVANLSNRFQVGNCAALDFKPRTNVRLFGGIARGKYQGVRAVVRPRPGDANISRTVVRFPRSAFVAQEHLKDICTRVQWAADACPKRSIYGRAIAYSPLLDEPLRGPVRLRAGDNELPDLVADLRGPAHQPIRIEVAVRNDSVRGALRNTVQAVPDAPVSYFRLQTFGRAKGLIVNSRNICKGKNQARVAMAAHNGRRSVQNVNVFNKRCKAYKRKLRKNKRRAKRKAHRSVAGATPRGGR